MPVNYSVKTYLIVNIKKQLAQNKLTAREFCKINNLSYRAFNFLLSKKSKSVNFSLIDEIAKSFKISVIDLFKEFNEEDLI